MLPTFQTTLSGAATTAAWRQDARTHMSFDFHGVISSHRVRAHRTWIGQPLAGPSAERLRRRNDRCPEARQWPTRPHAHESSLS